jgi:hypothetical protein
VLLCVAGAEGRTGLREIDTRAVGVIVGERHGDEKVHGTDEEVSLYRTGEPHTIGSGAAGAWLPVVQEQVAVFFAHSAAACPTAMFKAAE